MIPQQSPEIALYNLLGRIALAPNNQVSNRVFSEFQGHFQENFPFAKIKINNELTQRFLLAESRLRCMKDVPQPLQNLMQRLQTCINRSLQIHPVLASHLQDIMGDQALQSSMIDSFLLRFNLHSNCNVTYSDLFVLLGSSWGGMIGNTIEQASITDPIHTIKTFYSIIGAIEGTQSSLWKKYNIDRLGPNLAQSLEMGKKGLLLPPSQAILEELKTSNKSVYVPIGYGNTQVFFMSLLAIEYRDQGYQLRLLTANNTPILSKGIKEDHYCPEVVWKGLDIEQLLQRSFWKPLLEAATLNEQETKKINCELYKLFLAFDATHLVAWLTQRLGKNPQAKHIKIADNYWEITLKNSRDPYRFSLGQLSQHEKNPLQVPNSVDEENGKQVGEFLLEPTSKDIKKARNYYTLHKFVNLLPLDHFPCRNEWLLFKAESRLALLVAAYKTLKEKTSPPLVRGKFLRLIELSWGKVTAPIEKLMQHTPSQEQRQSARILLVSILDLKHRIADLMHLQDQTLLNTTKSLYPSTHTVHQLTLSKYPFTSIDQALLDTLRLSADTPPLPYFKQWTQECFAEAYKSLEMWYDILLDAKQKCEPVELITLAHRNIFSKLPIPTTENVGDTFPDQISEGLQVATLLLLKKISSLVASQVYAGFFVPPLFVTDLAKVYRFSIELYRHINPDVQQLPVSWFALHQYFESRNSYHVPGEVTETLNALIESFRCISPQGHLKPSDEFPVIPLFYSSSEKFPRSYQLPRQLLGMMPLNKPQSVDEILSIAELADSVGIRPEDTTPAKEDMRWGSSFNGQCVSAISEIAQHFTMSVFVTPGTYRKFRDKKSERISLLTSTGPEDHLQLPPPTTHVTYETTICFGFGTPEFADSVRAAKTPVTHRMIRFTDKQIAEPVNNLPLRYVDEWRSQADLLKALPKRSSMIYSYQLHQAASGHSEFSLDLLLEFFEVRPALLLNRDYRAYFSAIAKSANILKTMSLIEPLLLDRLKNFISTLYSEDRENCEQNILNFERMLWLSALTRYLCRLSQQAHEMFSPVLGKIVQDLEKLTYKRSDDARLAPHIIASQQYLHKDLKLSIPELARLHLLTGSNPPTDPNDVEVYFEAVEAMQREAPNIQKALFTADEPTRRAIWAHIFISEEEIQKALNRKHQNIELTTLVKTSAQRERLTLKQNYLQHWLAYLEKCYWDDLPWRTVACKTLLHAVDERLDTIISDSKCEQASLLHRVQEVYVTTPTMLIIQMGAQKISVDWESGRIMGAMRDISTAKRL